MATHKYNIFDEQGNSVGHLLIKQPQTFENTIDSVSVASGPLADASLFVVVLGGFTVAPWLAGAPGWLAASVGVGLTATLAGIKAWRGSFSLPDPVPDEVVFKGEFKNSDDGTIHLDQISDPKIDRQKLIKFCNLLVENDFVWVGRPKAKLWAGISRGQHERIAKQFTLNNWFMESGGSDRINSRGRLMVRYIAGQLK